MVSQKKGNPSESVNLAGDTQWGLGETGNTPVVISRYFIARLRAVINVPQNYEITMPAFFGSRSVTTGAYANQKMWAFFCFFGGAL
jgi:hypothetical protein